MATFRRFEDITAWQKARTLVKDVYQVSGKGDFRKDFGLKDQIRRASVSIMANIAEGFERDSHGERIRFLMIAKGSVGEVRSHLYVAFDLGYISQTDFTKMKSEAETISKMIGGLAAYLRKDKISNAKEPSVEYNAGSYTTVN